MIQKVETPNSKLQKVTLLVQMTEFEPDEGDLDAGEWLLNVLMACANEHKPYSHYGAQAYLKAAQVFCYEKSWTVLSNIF